LTSQEWFKPVCYSASDDRLPPHKKGIGVAGGDVLQLVKTFNDQTPRPGTIDTRQMPNISVANLFLSQCFICKQVAVWRFRSMIYPTRGDVPPANADIPEDIRRDYDEAASILDASPRGSAALLRLVVERLCKLLGQSGKDINDDIAALVADGLSKTVQKSLDAVRVIGNNAVHAGKLDIRDDRETASALFELVNLIAQRMITDKRRVEEVYQKLPQSIRDQIDRRNI
jgi:hypothetical protein